MKKTFKLLVTLILALCIFFTLTGCSFIDEMRASQGFWQENENIIFNGNEYILLPECDSLIPNSEECIYITEPDVPVLLSERLGTKGDLSVDRTIISLGEKTYCRKDKYDEVYSEIMNGIKYDTYCCVYYKCNDDTYTSKLTCVKLSKAEVDAINQTLEKGEKIFYDDFLYNDYMEELNIEIRSSDMLFYDIGFDIIKDKNNYYVDDYNNEDYFLMRVVPKSLAPVFDKMFEKYADVY